MPRKYIEILHAWESEHGDLTFKYRKMFFGHRALPYIACYQLTHINQCLSRHAKLDDILKELERNYWPPPKKYPGSTKRKLKSRYDENETIFQSGTRCKYCRQELASLWGSPLCINCDN